MTRTITRTRTIHVVETITVSDRPSRPAPAPAAPAVVDAEGEELQPSRPQLAKATPRNLVQLRLVAGGAS